MIRDRIKEVRKVSARELRRNPRNWRLHPESQKGALRAVLDSVGMVGTLLARETKDGLELLDGHLRADLADDAAVTVAVTDLDDREADIVLATFDHLGTMALIDQDKLQELIEVVGGDQSVEENAELRRVIADLSEDLAKDESEEPDKGREVEGMALEPHEHYDFLVVLATTAQEFNILCEKLGLQPQARRGRMGTARAIRAAKLVEALNGAALQSNRAEPEAAPQHAAHSFAPPDGDYMRGRKRG